MNTVTYFGDMFELASVGQLCSQIIELYTSFLRRKRQTKSLFAIDPVFQKKFGECGIGDCVTAAGGLPENMWLDRGHSEIFPYAITIFARPVGHVRGPFWFCRAHKPDRWHFAGDNSRHTSH